MPANRPTIGVTGPDHGGAAAWLFTALAVRLAGGRPVRITPQHPHPIDELDGLILGGGADVDPTLYGKHEPVAPTRRPEDPALLFLLELLLLPLTWLARKLAGFVATHAGQDHARDDLEIRLLEQAVDRGLPILGICRGQQLINVFFGGSLHPDLAGFYTETAAIRTILPKKRVRIEPGTRLARLFPHEVHRVNALHDQGIATLGQGLVVSARDKNQIIQAIEHPAHPFLLAVQWHPEYLPQRAEQRALFGELVAVARSAREADVTPPPHPARIPPAASPAFPPVAPSAGGRR